MNEALPKGLAAASREHGVNFSAPFIQRPVATFLLSAAVILAGLAGYSQLPTSSLPQVEFAVISVSAQLPGANPETMASAVVTPLERQFGRIAGVNELTSVSSTGSASITLQFDLGRDINGAARDVQAAINAARSQLPSNMPQNPSYKKVNPGDSASLVFALTSEVLTPAQLYDQADSVLAQKIAQVEGVGQVVVSGSARPAVRVEANPSLLAQSGLGLEAVRTAIGTMNVNKPKGFLASGDFSYTVAANDQLFGADRYVPQVISVGKQGKELDGITRLKDIGEVVDGVEDSNTFGSFNGHTGVLVNVLKAPGANVIQMVDDALALLPQLQASVPPSVRISVALNRTVAIRESVKEVTRTLVISIALVVVVVFVFLREWRSTLIPSVSVPLSLFGTFAVMYLLHYTLDNLSLMALTIATGFVVDDAIVVMENIMRHLEAGMSPLAASLQGSKEIGFTVVSMSVSLIAVFLPILLMGGIVGRLFREFAITLSVSILVSLVISLSTTPMLSALFLKENKREHGAVYSFGESMLNWMNREYALGLEWVLRHQALVLFVTLATFGLNVYLYVLVPKGFFPEMDAGRLSGQVRGQQDVGFAALRSKAQKEVGAVRAVPGVANTMLTLGGSGAGNTASLGVFLSDAKERLKNGDSVDVVLDKIRRGTKGVPGATLSLQSSQELKIGARSSAGLYQYSLTSDDLVELNDWAPKLQEAMEEINVLRDVTTDQQSRGMRAQLVIDRDSASRYGVSALAIDQTLSDAFSQRQVSTLYRPMNQYHVVLEVAPQYRDSLDALSKVFVKSESGGMVPLVDVTKMSVSRIPITVNHQSQSPAVTLSFNLAPGASLSAATEAIEVARSKIGMPSSIRGGFQGTAQAFQDSLKSEPILIASALIAVYILLGMLYESLIHPLTILSTLPSAGVGAIVALLLFKTEFSVIAMIGVLLLIGIVKKNAIMMIDFALVAERVQGIPPRDAIFQACMLRFRPIMMTTMAALLGAIPLAIGTGPGSELRKPLGITIIGGLIVSQALTLFTTPVIYLFFDGVQAGIRARMHGAKTSPRARYHAGRFRDDA